MRIPLQISFNPLSKSKTTPNPDGYIQTASTVPIMVDLPSIVVENDEFTIGGVLVGAMLGLVARMRFRRVLLACLIGGSAASVTWAYTARGIIEFMEKYHAQTFIPFLILLAFVFTFLHLRRNKRRRREELFRESMAFFATSSNSNA